MIFDNNIVHNGSGSAIYFANPSDLNEIVYMINMSLTNNTAGISGTFYYGGKNVVAESTTFEDNKVISGNGAAICMPESQSPSASITLKDCKFRNNFAGTNGSIYVGGDANMSISGNQFLYNDMDTGAVVYTVGRGNIIMKQCDVIGNNMINDGSIRVVGGDITINNSVFDDNDAINGNGAVIYNLGSGSILMENTNLTNHISGGFGTVRMITGPITLNNIRIINNDVQGGDGSAVSVDDGMYLYKE